MVNCSLLFKEAEVILKRKIADRLVVLERGIRVCKFRLYISEDLFVQVYRNDIYNTTNMALILGRIRLYGRDQINGQWHRHPYDQQPNHDFSKEGTKEVSLLEFWNEVEALLQQLGLD